ncbi:MAG: hydroxylamine reductase, partial [Bacilli bacterium]|nr:hydroxylamine reductase [Bacilli bacterium]
MFCFQCQETAMNKGCTMRGVCGKTSEVANLQDLLIHLMRGISKVAIRLREKGEKTQEANLFIMDGLFMTITNANFDQQRFVKKIND